MTKTACCSHTVDLFILEQENIVKLSKLSSISVSPKAYIKRQRVPKCLQVLRDETIAALKTYHIFFNCFNIFLIDSLSFLV